jgi:hypothetical protein
MTTQQVQKQLFKVYTEADHTFIQVPSHQVLTLSSHLRGHGIQTLSPRPVSMDVHRLKLPANSDLKAIQLLVDHWTAAQAALSTPDETAKNGRVASRTTFFGP